MAVPDSFGGFDPEATGGGVVARGFVAVGAVEEAEYFWAATFSFVRRRVGRFSAFCCCQCCYFRCRHYFLPRLQFQLI